MKDRGHEDAEVDKSQLVEEEGPACISCRKKKAKCSRRQPCSQCVRFNVDCLYDERKSRPGLRTGVVDNLTQRVNTLENMFLGQGVLWQQVWNSISALQGHVGMATSSSHDSSPQLDGTLQDRTSKIKATLTQLSSSGTTSDYQGSPRGKKRRRIGDVDETTASASNSQLGKTQDLEDLPDDLVDDLVETYFASIQPWIPILHVKQFRQLVSIPEKRSEVSNILHAIISVCVRFSHDPRLSNHDFRTRHTQRSRQKVILQSMESFSVTNLQALVILAFDTIGCGRGPSAWSIVGSMTRTVEQLQLSVEDEEDQGEARSVQYLIQRMAFLGPPKTWIESEERRRVFWNVFLMDRFCGVATGWNFSLTSADVRRRLPCEGALWERGKPVRTPYFGIDGNPLGNSPSVITNKNHNLEEQEALGGFAYCIEATESLGLVTMFFLRHAVNVSNAHDVQMWLMRFKELDLRLVQWKLFLPEKWREASVLNVDGIMDPNLTLAHITHNTAVCLLHQGIAYPSPQWQKGSVQLPSSSSAETCLAAASEVSIIAEKYLLGSNGLTNPQFAFCLFISGRMLLAHAAYYNTPLPKEFDTLTRSLFEISRRWAGPYGQPGSGHELSNLASKFASRLSQALDKSPSRAVLDIRHVAYSETQDKQNTAEVMEHSGSSPNINESTRNDRGGQYMGTNYRTLRSSNMKTVTETQNVYDIEQESPESVTLAFPPLPASFQNHFLASESQTKMSSPMMTGDQRQNHQASNGFADTDFGPPGFEPNIATFQDLNTTAFVSNNFEDFNSFFDYSFLPDQRVSVFSGARTVGTGNSAEQ